MKAYLSRLREHCSTAFWWQLGHIYCKMGGSLVRGVKLFFALKILKFPCKCQRLNTQTNNIKTPQCPVIGKIPCLLCVSGGD